MAKSTAGNQLSWSDALKHLDMTSIVIIIMFGIVTAAVQRIQPVQRPVFLYDATISYQYMGDHDFPFWLALLVPFIVLLITALIMEFIFIAQNRKRASAMLVNVILAALAALAVVGFLTELFKRICGRLRPDYLDRCQPADMNVDFSALEVGQTITVQCTSNRLKSVKDGRLSFPSGHSSCSMAVGLFAALYLIWCVFLRNKGNLAAKLLQSPNPSWLTKLKGDSISLGVVLLLLFDIAWPWGIAASRFIDNRHNVSDVVGGLLIAVCFVPIFVIRLASSSEQWSASCRQAEVNGVPMLPVTALEAEGHLSNMHNDVVKAHHTSASHAIEVQNSSL